MKKRREKTGTEKDWRQQAGIEKELRKTKPNFVMLEEKEAATESQRVFPWRVGEQSMYHRPLLF